jgi:hypothetical protein
VVLVVVTQNLPDGDCRCLLATTVMVFFNEIVAALALPPRRLPYELNRGVRQRVAVLVPAHNETSGLLPTLADIQSQLIPGNRLFVVADNCSDDTHGYAAAGFDRLRLRSGAGRP